jgi:protein-tyrosine-phosphatase
MTDHELPDPTDPPDASFGVVFICTANRARSPTAEAFLLAQRVPGVRVSSFGVLELGGAAALEPAVKAATHFGIDISSHRAHPLEGGELADSDLVVGFEPAHVSAAIVDGRAPVERTFSLAELAGILSSLEPRLEPDLSREEVRQLAHASRPVGFLSTPVVPDPLGGSDQRFLEVAGEIGRHVRVIAEVLLRR